MQPTFIMTLLNQEIVRSLLTAFFALIGFLLILIMMGTKIVIFLLNTFTKKKINIVKKTVFIPLVGVSFIAMLTVVANNAFIYGIAVIIIATLITELEFLEKLMALLWNRKDYWQYQGIVAISKTPQQESPKEKKVLEGFVKKMEAPITSNPDKKDQLDTSWFLFYHYERVYRLIFGSQIGLLQYLSIVGNKGLAKFEIGESYKHNPISSSYPLENYIGFLENNKLIQLNPVNNAYLITPMGSGFLIYLNNNQIPTNKPN